MKPVSTLTLRSALKEAWTGHPWVMFFTCSALMTQIFLRLWFFNQPRFSHATAVLVSIGEAALLTGLLHLFLTCSSILLVQGLVWLLRWLVHKS